MNLMKQWRVGVWLAALIAVVSASADEVAGVQAAATNATEAILQQPGFREGLVWVGTEEPAEAESVLLLDIIGRLDQPAWRGEVEQFLRDHPNSPWAASLHHAYASFCRRTGRTSKALEHWEAAWGLLKEEASDSGKRLGGSVLAGWMELLSSLGRVEQLRELAAAGDQWPFVNRRDREQFLRAKDSFYRMQTHPGIAYRCGTLAVKAVGQSLQPTNRALESLVDVPSPTNGFSVAALLEMAGQRGLNLIAVRRPERGELVVPSVVHWRQNHYAAILDQREGNYLVSDPTFGGPKWLPWEVIDEEAGGVFLVPVGTEKPGWTRVDRVEAGTIRGKGLVNGVADGKDKGNRDPCAEDAAGMPVFWVTEPYLNLWLADEPVFYLTSRGERFGFRMTYKQRDTLPTPGNHVVTPAGWNHNWFSYIRLEAIDTCGSGVPCTFPVFPWSDATLYLPNGGEVFYPFTNRYDQETRTRLEKTAPSAPLDGSFDQGNDGLRVIHADGSQDIYGFGVSTSVPSGDYPYTDFMLTRRIDPHGNTTRFWYEVVGLGFTTAYRLKQVVDYDGRTNTLRYTTFSITNMVLTEVENPYGRIAYFQYDQNKNLTNITDAAGLSSSLQYDTNGYPTHLITPYGTNRFELIDNAVPGQGNAGGHDLISRAAHITDPTGATHLYAYRYDSPFLPTNYPAGDVPANTPLNTLDDGSGGTNQLAAVAFRNSFYWNPRQYTSLSTTNLSSLTANDYLRGRMRHWLQDTNDLTLSGLLSVERAPSPDGQTEGLKVFYDYEGKLYRHRMGTNSLPSVRAWRLPGGETHYEWLRYDTFGNLTNRVTTFTKPDGSLGARTNEFAYEINTYTNVIGVWENGELFNSVTNTFAVPNLLARIVESDGSNVWTFGGFEPITWTNDFPVGSLYTNRVLLSSRRVLPRYLTNAVNEITELSFTGFNRIAGVQWPEGLTTTNLYDTGGFLWRAIDLEIGRTNTFAYTTHGLIGVHTNELGRVTTFTWDNLLRLTSAADARGYVSNRYDKLDLVARRDRLGHWQTFGYDAARRLTAHTNELNHVTRWSWCGCGTLEAITNAINEVTLLSHDPQSRLTGIIFATNIAFTLQYDPAGRLTNLADNAGVSLQAGYNHQGLLTSLTNAFGEIYRAVFDERDRPVRFKDAAGVWTTNTFDAANRLLTRKEAGGEAERFGYSLAGLSAYTNQNHQITRLGHDAAGRLKFLTNHNQEILQFGYDPAHNLTNLIDGLNQKTAWQFDAFNRLTRKFDHFGSNVLHLAYDAGNRLTNRWTPQQGDAALQWDDAGNLLSVRYPQATNSYTYDPLHRLTNMVDAAGATKFNYSRLGALAIEDGPWSDDTVTFHYGAAHRLASISVAQPGGGNWTQSFLYDAAGRMTNLASPLGAFGYSYVGASSLIQKLVLPNFASITNHYDALARLDHTALLNRWGHPLAGASYLHDPLGLRTNVTRHFGLSASKLDLNYDGIGQLTAMRGYESNGAPRLNEQREWAYDAAGNLRYRTNDALAQTFTADARNQLESVTRTGALTVSGATPAPAASVTVNGQNAERYADFTFASTNHTLNDGANTFTVIAENLYGLRATNTLNTQLPSTVNLSHDANGNLTNDGLRSFAYDAENQLTNVTVAGQWKSDFVYDGLGRKRIERSYSWTGSAWSQTNEVRYVYEGMLVAQERDANNQPTVIYTRGLDLSGTRQGAGGIGGLLARTDANGTAYYHGDGAGNIDALIDEQGLVVARYLYDPFGNPIAQWGELADANRYRFSSKEIHPASGLYYYGFRFYDPNLQRWLNPDPVGERGGINLYRFGINSPLNVVDAFGLWPDPIITDAGGGMQNLIGSVINSITDELGEGIYAFFYAENPPPPLPFPYISWDEVPREMWPEPVQLTGEPPTDQLMLEGLLMIYGPGWLKGPCPQKAVVQGTTKFDKLADDILDWVGPKSTLDKPPGGSDLILRSADGTRQIRFDLTNPHGLQPHVNVETFKPRNRFPQDRKMIETGNEHVYPKP